MLGGLAAQSPQQGAPVRVLRLGEPGERAGQRFGEVTALHRRRRLVGHGVDSTGLPDPLDEQAGLADAPTPPDQPQPTALCVPQSKEPMHLRGTIQKFHIVIMPMCIILSSIMFPRRQNPYFYFSGAFQSEAGMPALTTEGGLSMTKRWR